MKILDFGLAKLGSGDRRPEAGGRSEVDRNAPMLVEATQPGMILGTVGYMSPEQVRGESTDHRSDIFSFGAVLFEMLTGKRAFHRPTTAETMTAILKEEPPELSKVNPQLPLGLERIVNRCLEKSPVDRFQSARDLAFALEGLSDLGPRAGAVVPFKVDLPQPKLETPEKSVAVLPFVNMSSDRENEYLSDGITEDLIAALSKISGLRVPARTSSFAFKGKNEDFRVIGDKLSVTTVLEGSLRKSGNKLRITAQLVKVSDGYHLWSETYDPEMRDVFAIQDEITRATVTALKVQLVGEADAPLVKAPTGSMEAYQLYLQRPGVLVSAWHRYKEGVVLF